MVQNTSVVEDLALGAFRMVKETLGLDLDFAAETLPLLDHYLLELRGDGSSSPDRNAVGVAAPCAGAYFGEVVRRTLPGFEWRLPPDPEEYQAWRIEGTRVPISFNPIGAALEAVHGEALAEWNAHLSLPPTERALVDAVLSGSSPVRAQDFYRLTVRHEVLEQVLAVLARS